MQKIFVKTAVRGYSVLRAFGVCTHTRFRVSATIRRQIKKCKKKSVRTTDFFISGMADSNRRPLTPEASALPAALIPDFSFFNKKTFLIEEGF